MKLIDLINKYTYNYEVQLTFLSLWILGLFLGPIFIQSWFMIGLAIWVTLMVYRNRNSYPNQKVGAKSGPLAYIVGLNWCVILSILSIAAIFIIKKSDEDTEGQN